MNPELWSRAPLLTALSFLPVPLGVAWMALAGRLPWARSARGSEAAGWLTWIATRAAFAALVWGALGHLSIDALAFFLPQARAAAAGGLVYRDFASAYAPLFPYLMAGALGLFGRLGPLVLFLLADLAAWRVLRAVERHDPVAPAFGTAWWYLAFPPVWYFAVRYAQDETLAALCVALALQAARRGRASWCGLALAAGLLATKPLFALLAIPFLLRPGLDRPRLLRAMLIPVGLAYGALLAAGAPVWQPLALEGASFGIGPTLWRVPVVLWHFDLGAFAWLPFLATAAIGAALLSARRASAEEQGAFGFAAFALLGPKCMPMYVVSWAPLLAAWVGGAGAAGPAAAASPGGTRATDAPAAPAAGRKRWWTLYGLMLPSAWYLDSGPLQGMFGPIVQALAALGLVAVAALSAWPMVTLLRGERR